MQSETCAAQKQSSWNAPLKCLTLASFSGMLRLACLSISISMEFFDILFHVYCTRPLFDCEKLSIEHVLPFSGIPGIELWNEGGIEVGLR